MYTYSISVNVLHTWTWGKIEKYNLGNHFFHHGWTHHHRSQDIDQHRNQGNCLIGLDLDNTHPDILCNQTVPFGLGIYLFRKRYNRQCCRGPKGCLLAFAYPQGMTHRMFDPHCLHTFQTCTFYTRFVQLGYYIARVGSRHTNCCRHICRRDRTYRVNRCPNSQCTPRREQRRATPTLLVAKANSFFRCRAMLVFFFFKLLFVFFRLLQVGFNFSRTIQKFWRLVFLEDGKQKMKSPYSRILF